MSPLRNMAREYRKLQSKIFTGALDFFRASEGYKVWWMKLRETVSAGKHLTNRLTNCRNMHFWVQTLMQKPCI
jgi:hypothetical protein